MANVVFYDKASGSPLFTATLPETAQLQAQLSVIPDQGTTKLQVQGCAIDQANNYELYFQSGESYSNQQANPGQPQTSNFHQLCDAADQLDEYAAQFIGGTLAAANKFHLPKERLEKLNKNGSESISKTFAVLQQVGQMGQIKMNVQCTGTILDGAMGVYPFVKDGQQKTLYSAIWRVGLSVSIGGMFGMFNPGGTSGYTLWSVPCAVNMVSHGPLSEDAMRIFNTFIATFDDSPEFQAYARQVSDANLNVNLQMAAASARQTQAQIDNMWAQHNAAWARSEALSKSLSQDLDNFRAGLAANSAAMDAFHSNLSSMNSSSSFGSSFSDGESLDDRIQRQRHESIMGVNTFEREDGTTYEHTIMDNRVFENNLDSNTHFGTQNYYGDYVPDGWTELNQKK